MSAFDKSERERRLEQEIQRLHEKISDQNRRRWEAEDKRRVGRQAVYIDPLNHALDWPDGFRKGLFKFQHEAELEDRDNREMKDDPEWKDQVSTWFTDQAKIVQIASEIYNEESTKCQPEIKRLEALIEEQKTLIRIRTADRIEVQFKDAESLVKALRENNPDWLTYW